MIIVRYGVFLALAALPTWFSVATDYDGREIQSVPPWLSWLPPLALLIATYCAIQLRDNGRSKLAGFAVAVAVFGGGEAWLYLFGLAQGVGARPGLVIVVPTVAVVVYATIGHLSGKFSARRALTVAADRADRAAELVRGRR